jgi:hypothetical protein
VTNHVNLDSLARNVPESACVKMVGSAILRTGPAHVQLDILENSARTNVPLATTAIVAVCRVTVETTVLGVITSPATVSANLTTRVS